MLDISGKLITWIVASSLLGWLLGYFVPPVYEFFELPGIAKEALFQPWSFITYGFLHKGFFHLLFNMLVLNVVGRGILNVLGSKPFMGIFFMGVLAGGIGFVLATFIAPTYFMASGIVGASAGVYALLFFLCFYLPDTQVQLIVWNVKLVYIAYVLLAIDLGTVVLGFRNAGGSVAHLMGAGLGYLGATQMLKGNDITAVYQSFVAFFSNLFNRSKKVQKKSPLKTVYKNKAPKPYKQYDEKSSQQAAIDAVLDKISVSGYDSLSASEKEVLFKAGKE